MKPEPNRLMTGTVTLLVLIFFSGFLAACSNDEVAGLDAGEDPGLTFDDTDFEPTDWTVATHSKDADPDFGTVFDDNTIKRIDLVITAARWATMLADMTDLFGPVGSGGGMPLDIDQDPTFVPAEVFFDGIEWYRVGVRFKGNASLQSTWHSGILKLPFKLDFDEFEDTYPQINNQRFFGFKQLSLKNNYLDKSMLREKVAGDVFRNSGLPGSHTAFYTLYVDHGDGPEYFGVYTMVEEVDDTVLDTQFSERTTATSTSPTASARRSPAAPSAKTSSSSRPMRTTPTGPTSSACSRPCTPAPGPPTPPPGAPAWRPSSIRTPS